MPKTMQKINTICFVPARMGSKSIKFKNIKKVKNKELIKYTFEFCNLFKTKFITVVSTDSKKIIKISKKYKIYNNGLRPKKLSGDKILTFDVIKYELKLIEKQTKKKFENILVLQPTCPFRKETTLKKALNLIKKKRFDSITTISDVGANHPERMKIIKNDLLLNYNNKKKENLKPRQSLKKVYIRSGSIYLIKRDAFFKNKSLVGNKCKGLVVVGKEQINIDNSFDLKLANIV
jgi:CMP-N,N'-diacetyllegionaminic acid synthase